MPEDVQLYRVLLQLGYDNELCLCKLIVLVGGLNNTYITFYTVLSHINTPVIENSYIGFNKISNI